MAEPSSIPTSSVWGFQSFHVLSVIIICRFNYSHPSECSGYLIIVLICLFRWLRRPAFFHVLIVHLHKEKPIWILCPSLIVFYLFDKGLLEVTHCSLFTSVWVKGVDLKKNLKQIIIWAECMIDNPLAQWVKNPLAMQETQETQVQSLGREDPLEEGMTTHCSILVWKIPRTEELGGLQSIGSQRVRHDWSDLACTHSIVHIPHFVYTLIDDGYLSCFHL